jgi:hypothetical protein
VRSCDLANHPISSRLSRDITDITDLLQNRVRNHYTDLRAIC